MSISFYLFVILTLQVVALAMFYYQTRRRLRRLADQSTHLRHVVGVLSRDIVILQQEAAQYTAIPTSLPVGTCSICRSALTLNCA